jgi:hypothetical protein
MVPERPLVAVFLLKMGEKLSQNSASARTAPSNAADGFPTRPRMRARVARA